jgi:uncharacterized membrane protein
VCAFGKFLERILRAHRFDALCDGATALAAGRERLANDLGLLGLVVFVVFALILLLDLLHRRGRFVRGEIVVLLRISGLGIFRRPALGRLGDFLHEVGPFEQDRRALFA